MLKGARPAPSTPQGLSKPAQPLISFNQVDVGKLIESLDADILSSEMGSRENSPPPRSAPLSNNHISTPRPPAANAAAGNFNNDKDADNGLKMKIKRTKSGRQEIVKTLGGTKSPAFNGNFDEDGVKSSNTGGNQPPPPFSSSGGGPTSLSSSGPTSRPVTTGMTPSSMTTAATAGGSIVTVKSENATTAVKSESNGTASMKTELSTSSLHQLTSKPIKVDAGTLTDACTETEAEMLGACEPGTPVNLEGIVWHETDTGVLVVNITWRGKTYVGTLLDCARHTNQWSAPRFTDSPEPGGKGRGKRGRTNTAPSEPEPRKNLRSQKGKGKGGKGSKKEAAVAAVQEEEFNFPAPASPAKDQAKRKKEADCDESKKRKRTSSDSDDASTPTEEEIKPVVPVKKEPKPVSYSYTLLSCPRKECGKKYKEDEGLKWHVSHSHPEFIGANGEIRDSAEVEREEQDRKRKARSREEKKEREKKEAKDNGEKGTPAKQPKLDDKASAPAPDKQKTAPPTLSTPQRTPSNPPPKTPVYSTPVNNGRLPDSADDLRQKGKLIATADSPVMLSQTVPPSAHILSNPPPLLSTPVAPPVEREKPPAPSPAYSDISDDGEDVRGKDLKLPQGLPNLPPSSVIGHSSSSSLYHPPLPAAPQPPSRSSPLTSRTELVSSLNTAPRSMSYVVPGTNSDPQPGTPEYHKYLAANGFPPFPYPYPVGMDPNYHIQLLKTDPGYKAKWEKDRADRERAFKEQLDKDQGKFSGLSLLKEDRLQSIRKPDHNRPEDLRKREPSGDNRPRSRASPVINTISVKPEFREKEDVKKEVKMEEGVKPTMETRGPPPGPQTFGYMHPSLVRPPYTMSMGGMPSPFDPIFAGAGMSHLSPYGLPPLGGPSPYLSPAHLSAIRPPGVPFSFADPMLRNPFPIGAADELARAAAAGAPPPGISGTKALDLLQQHASQYYANQKLAELQERALKSPSSSLSSGSTISGPGPGLPKPITTMAGKDSPTLTLSGDKSKSPPPLRHVHTHTHTHIGLGYPLLPPGALPPVPGGIPPVPSLPPGALPPPPVGVASVPFSGASPYSGKSPG